jgi:PAS domain S-box-containing protein
MSMNDRAKLRHRWLKVADVWRRHNRNRPSADLFQLTAHFTPDLIYEWYPDQDQAVYFGDIDARLGYEPGEFPRSWSGFESVIYPQDLPFVRAAMKHSLESRQFFDEVYRIFRKDGSVRYWRDRGQGICDDQGNLIRFVGVTTDVTEQRQAEEALKELNATLEKRVAERSAELEKLLGELRSEVDQRQQAEARFRMMSELTSDFGYQVRLRPDGGFNVEWASVGLSQSLGYSLEEISTSEKWIDKIHPDDRWITRDNIRRTAMGEPGSGIVRFRKPDGSYIWLQIFNRPGKDASGTRIESIYGAGQDITERKQAEEALSQSQARYRTLFDDSPVSLWEEDFSGVKAALEELRQDGVNDFRAYFATHPEEAFMLAGRIMVIDVNRAALKLYNNISKEELAANIGNIIRDYPDRWIEELIAIAEGRTDFVLEGTSSHEKTFLYHTILHFSVVRGYEQNFGRAIISIEDMTAHRKVEDALHKEARRLELTNSITLASLSLGNLKQTLHTLTERMCEFGEADACFITRWDAERQIPILLAGTGEIENQSSSLFLASGEASITRAALETGRIVVARSDDPQPSGQQFGVLSGNRSALALPLKVGEEKIGAAVLVYNRPPDLNEGDIDLWQQVAAQVSLAIASLQLFEKSQRRADELEKLTRVSSELRVAQASKDILDILVREMVQIVDADRGALVIRRNGKWLLEAERTDPEFGEMGEFQLSDPIAQEILRRSQEYFFADPLHGAYFPNCPWQKGLDSVMVIPLNTTEAMVGLVAIGWRHPKELAAVDQRLLTAVAEMGGNALQRSSLVETLEQRVADRTRDLQILFNLSAMSNGQHGLKKVIQSALKQLMVVLGGSAGIAYLVNTEVQAMEVEISHGLPRRVVSQLNLAPLDLAMWHKNAGQQGPVFFKDVTALPIPSEALVELGFNAAICMPIEVSGQPWGILCILGDIARLNPEEHSLLAAVADLVAAAAENAQLQKRAKEVAVMEERHRLARALHDSVTQSLYSLSLFSEAGREHSLAGNQERTLHYLERSSETAHRALREMRMLLYELRPPELDRLGLAGALRHRLEAVEQRVGLEARFTVKTTSQISADVEEALFWIAQEVLNNILKHADASKVFLNLQSDPEQVLLEIQDNGQGFELDEQNSGGMGLVSMRERAAKIGASLKVESKPGSGTLVEVKLNLDSSGKENIENG